MSKPVISASTVLIKPMPDNTYRLLLLERKKGGNFSRAYIFPGGSFAEEDKLEHWKGLVTEATKIMPGSEYYDSVDVTSLKLTAVKKTYLETKIFVGSGKIREDTEGENFLKRCQASKATPDLSKVHFYIRTVTPPEIRKRYDTLFFIVEANSDAECITNTATERAEWLTPLEIINLADKNRLKLLPPQLYIIAGLCRFPTLPELKAGLERASGENSCWYGSVTMDPKSRSPIASLPGDETFPYQTHISSKTGQKHRIYLNTRRGVKVEVSPGLWLPIKDSKWELAKGKTEWSIQPSSKL